MNNYNDSVQATIAAFLEIKKEFFDFLPSLVNGLLILAIGLFLAFFAKWLSKKIVHWLYLLVPKKFKGSPILRERLNSFSVGTGRVVFLLMILLSVTISMEKMGFTVLFGWLQSMARFTPNIIGAILIIFIGWSLKNILSNIVAKTIEEAGVINSKAISEFIAWSIFLLSIFIAMEQVGIDLSLVATVFGIIIFIPFIAIFLALSLSIKTSFENIFACYHLKKVITVNDTLYINEKEMTILSLGPVFVTLVSEGQKISVSGCDFMQNNKIIKKES